MVKTIEIVNVVTEGDTIKYKLRDNTGLHLLKEEEVDAWVKYYHTENFGLSLESLPESVLLIPAMLYLMPVTYFYGVDLVVPSMDKTLYEELPAIYAAYSKIYGPFKEEWCGKVTVGNIVENKPREARYDKIVFFSGGVDAVHAGINNPGERSVLVSVPSVESLWKGKKGRVGADFIQAKESLIREFSAVVGSDWLLVTNNFQAVVFNDGKIQHELFAKLGLASASFRFDGWFGIKYIGNMCSVAPFAYAMGIHTFVMGSAFEPLEDKPAIGDGGAHPVLSGSFQFLGISFAEQDGISTRRSQKVKDIVEWCNVRGKKTKLWTCFQDNTEQCGKCTKCVRTQLNLLCAGENPKEWGFESFSDKRFSKLVRSYTYMEHEPCYVWDIVDSIDDGRVYPFGDGLLHWLKRIGYKEYFKRSRLVSKLNRLRCLYRIHRYPRYARTLFRMLKGYGDEVRNGWN